MADRALVRNAADPEQVKRASRVEQRRQLLFDSSLLAVMRTPAGRIVMWQLIANTGVHESVWDNSARIHYNAGRQDFGHDLIRKLRRIDEDLYDLMAKEARALERREDRETDAAHTPPATEPEYTDVIK